MTIIAIVIRIMIIFNQLFVILVIVFTIAFEPIIMMMVLIMFFSGKEESDCNESSYQ